MACRLFVVKPLPAPMLSHCQMDSWAHVSVKYKSEFYHFHSRKCIWNCQVAAKNGDHFVQGGWFNVKETWLHCLCTGITFLLQNRMALVVFGEVSLVGMYEINWHNKAQQNAKKHMQNTWDVLCQIYGIEFNFHQSFCVNSTVHICRCLIELYCS